MRNVIALGFFDGVHRGHGALLEKTVQRAGELGAVSAACSFDVHPETVIFGRETPLLSSTADREHLMRSLYGIQEVIWARFDQAMMTMPWDKFVRDYLVGELGACHLVAGHDHRFGYQGEGDPQKLRALCGELGIGCDIVEAVCVDGREVSSTLIRGLVAQGDMEEARRYLGHPHLLGGTVAHGKKLGSKLGFPTVNVTPAPEVLIPAHGVYVSQAVLEDGRRYMACTNIGVRPTVRDGDRVTVEGFLLDFDGDLYGQDLRLELYCRLRGERAFDSLEELSREVMRNADQTRAYFAGR